MGVLEEAWKSYDQDVPECEKTQRRIFYSGALALYKELCNDHQQSVVEDLENEVTSWLRISGFLRAN